MIVKENGFNPLIMFDNYDILPASEPEYQIAYRQFTIASLKITKKHIPKSFFIEEILMEPIMIGMPSDYQKPKVVEYMIQLKRPYKLIFRDKSIANLYFKILCSDFENVNIEEQHPELFL